MDRRIQREFTERFFGLLPPLNEEVRIEDIYEVNLKLKIEKAESKDVHALVTSTLTDIRSITRVTIVTSLSSKIKDKSKILTIRVKFNAKNLAYEGFGSPTDFVQRVLIPTIQKLDTKPRILSISPVHDVFRKKKKDSP